MLQWPNNCNSNWIITTLHNISIIICLLPYNTFVCDLFAIVTEDKMFSLTSAIVVVFMSKCYVFCCCYMLLSSCVYAVYVSVIVCNVAASKCHPAVVKCCIVATHPTVVKGCNVATHPAAVKCCNVATHPAVVKCCNAAAVMCAIIVCICLLLYVMLLLVNAITTLCCCCLQMLPL